MVNGNVNIQVTAKNTGVNETKKEVDGFVETLGKFLKTVGEGVVAALGFTRTIVALGVEVNPHVLGVSVAVGTLAAGFSELNEAMGKTKSIAQQMEEKFGKPFDILKRDIENQSRSDIKELIQRFQKDGLITDEEAFSLTRALAVQKAQATKKQREEQQALNAQVDNYRIQARVAEAERIEDAKERSLKLLEIEEEYEVKRKGREIKNTEDRNKLVEQIHQAYYQRRLTIVAQFHSQESLKAQQESSASRSPNVQPLSVKSASDLLPQVDAQMKSMTLSAAQLTQGMKRVEVQGIKTFRDILVETAKADKGFEAVKQTGLSIGTAIAQGLQSSTGQLKAVLKNLLTLYLDFLEKQLLEAEAAATLRTLFGDFSAIAQIAAGVAALELAKAAVNSFQEGGWINEPVVGRGLRSGQMYTLGERGPEYVMPNSQLQNARFANSFDTSRIEKVFSNLQLRTEIRGTDLAVIVERGNRINRGRRL